MTIFSEWYPYNDVPAVIILTASFAEPALQQPGTTVIVAMGIEVSEGIGSMKIVECFVSNPNGI